MKIDKSKLKKGIWYEDIDGNVYLNNDGCERPNEECNTYHTRFPLMVTENVQAYYDNKDTCKHPKKYRKPTFGWKKGIKGCQCAACGKTKVGKTHVPFAFIKWDDGPSKHDLMEGHISMCRDSGRTIVAMVNSGDYELDEAMIVMADACERCGNVLMHKYLGEDEGYAEYSEEWKKANTECDFCRKEQTNTEKVTNIDTVSVFDNRH